MARKSSSNIQLKVRMKEKLRAKIEAVAKHRGNSLNAEIVDRLEDSFVNRDDLFGGHDNYKLMRFLALGFEMVQRQTNGSWMTDFGTKEAAKSAMATFIDTFGAKPTGAADGESTRALADRLGNEIMKDLVADLVEHKKKNSEEEQADGE